MLVSKTGYTREAGLCLSMLLRVGERTVRLVLMGAQTAAERAVDVQNIVNALSGLPLVAHARPPADRAGPARAELWPVLATDIAEDSGDPPLAAVSDAATAPPPAEAGEAPRP